MTNTRTVVLGKLPAYTGQYVPGKPYPKFNQVTYLGAEFINTVEGNTNTPVTVVTDASGAMTSYTLNAGWQFTANSYDGSIYLKTITDDINKSYNFAPAYKVVQDTSTLLDSSNPFKYITYDGRQRLTEAEQKQARENIGAASDASIYENFRRVAFFDVVETV